MSAGLCFNEKFLKIRIPVYGKHVNQKEGGEEENNLSGTLCCYGKTGLWESSCLNQALQCLCCSAEIIILGTQNWSLNREPKKGSRGTIRTGIGSLEMKKLWRVYLWGDRNQQGWNPTESSRKVNTEAGSWGVF